MSYSLFAEKKEIFLVVNSQWKIEKAFPLDWLGLGLDQALDSKEWIWFENQALRCLEGEKISIEHEGFVNYHRGNYQLTLIPLDKTHLLVTSTDISEQKKTLQVAEEMAKNKSDFIATMSHEIRTPMNSIVVMTRLLMETSLNQEQKEYVERLQSGSNNLLTIVNGILDFSKIESGNMQIESAPFSVEALFDSVYDVLGPQLHGKPVDLLTSLGASAQELLGDENRLRQILLNLGGNAVKFTEKGQILLGYSIKKINQNNSEAIFSVKDTGIGIPLSKWGQLFQAFTQVTTSTSRKYGGTGLGLAISKKLVELMGGRIWVQSEEKKGTTFFFAIPYQPVISSTHIENIIPGKLVLYETVTSRINLFVQALTAKGFTVEVVSDFEKLKSALTHKLYSYLLITSLELAPEFLAWLVQNALNPDFVRAAVVVDQWNFPTSDRIKIFQRPAKISAIIKFLKNDKTQSMSLPELKLENKTGQQTLKILVVDDDLDNQRVIEILLKKIGYSIKVVSSGFECLKMIDQEKIDLVFMDEHMPEMDGLETTRRLRKTYSSLELPIVALTANTLPGEKERCLEAGMNFYLSKPIEIAKIKEVLKYYQTQKDTTR